MERTGEGRKRAMANGVKFGRNRPPWWKCLMASRRSDTAGAFLLQPA
jgi:hypothetical protein